MTSNPAGLDPGLSSRRARILQLFRARPEHGVRARAVTASVWTLLGLLTQQGLRLGSNLLLTRLLFPEAFGLMGLVAVLMQGLELFSDVGIGPSIIQNRRGDDPAFLRTAWTIQVMRGVALWIGACLLAWPMATFYQEPMLAQIVPIASLTAVIAAFNSTRLFTAGRHLAQARITLVSVAAQVVGVVLMVSWALVDRSVWALVGGGLAGAMAKMALSHVALPGIRDGFAWDATARAELFRFGKWIFIGTALTFLSQQADRLLLGRLLNMELLGVYMIAYFLTDAPRTLVKRLGAAVLFPAVARKAELPRPELRAKLMEARWRPLLLLSIAVAVMIAAGDWVVLALWDPRYAAASWMMPILAVGLWPMVLFNSLGPALLALGKPSYNVLGSIGRLGFVVVATLPAYHLAWVPGVVAVLALADIPNYVSVLLGLRRERMLALRQDAAATAVFAATVLLLLAARAGLGFGLPFDSSF